MVYLSELLGTVPEIIHNNIQENNALTVTDMLYRLHPRLCIWCRAALRLLWIAVMYP